MGLLDRFRSKQGTTGNKLGDSALKDPKTPAQKQSYTYDGPSLPKKPLTPQEIEELHAKIYPKKHEPEVLKPPRPQFNPQDYNGPLAVALDKKGLTASNQYTYSQSQSLLFSRLPREVRMQIWQLPWIVRRYTSLSRRGG